MAEQAAKDMETFIKTHVVSDMSCCCDLSWRDLQVLFHILHFCDGVTPAFLSYVTRFDPATILRANLKLADGGYIEISEHKVDGRSHSVSSTAKGEDAIAHMIDIYSDKQDQIAPRILPPLAETELKTIFSTCIKIQARAEQLSLVLPSGKIKRNTGSHYSGRYFSKPFEEFIKRPELVLHTFCQQTHSDYMKFFKAHVIAKMSTAKTMNIRELRTLMALQFFDHDATAMNVANILRFDPATVSRAVSALVGQGYLYESPKGVSDERKKPLALTRQGKVLAGEYLDRVQAAMGFANERLGETVDITTLKQCLSVLTLVRDRTAQLALSRARDFRVAS